jgi:bacterioferritin
MRHADRLSKRILVLGGPANLQDLGKLMVGEDVEDVLGCDLKLELKARPDLQTAIAHCEKAGDYVRASCSCTSSKTGKRISIGCKRRCA